MSAHDKKIELKKSYDRIAGLYDKFFSTPIVRKLERYEIETVLSLTDVKNKRVLDIGCGYGKFFNHWQDNKANLIVGLDFSKCMLNLAARRNSGAFCVLGDGFKLPFRDKKFDLSTCIGLAAHYKNMSPLLEEMARVTRESCVLSFPRALFTVLPTSRRRRLEWCRRR